MYVYQMFHQKSKSLLARAESCLTIITGKNCVFSVQYKNGWLAASDPLRVKMFEKCDSLNRE